MVDLVSYQVTTFKTVKGFRKHQFQLKRGVLLCGLLIIAFRVFTSGTSGLLVWGFWLKDMFLVMKATSVYFTRRVKNE